ncbi:MAG: bifunctional nuclease family protein [Candidatus Omnitrophica bacterium]|nr:bifunctional nuclease family protein [Candidatus Omnitrophota bacterium]
MKSENSNHVKEAKIFSLVLIPLLGQYVLTLEEVGGQRLVPIWIGVNEGNAIGLKLQDEHLPRPMTHDLMGNMLKQLGVKVERITVSDLRNGTYYAVITLNSGARKWDIDARPSDAMALAVRTNTPIFVDEKVLKKCPVIMKPISEEEVEKFKDHLQNLKPEDFFKGLEGKEGKEKGDKGEKGGKELPPPPPAPAG